MKCIFMLLLDLMFSHLYGDHLEVLLLCCFLHDLDFLTFLLIWLSFDSCCVSCLCMYLALCVYLSVALTGFKTNFLQKERILWNYLMSAELLHICTRATKSDNRTDDRFGPIIVSLKNITLYCPCTHMVKSIHLKCLCIVCQDQRSSSVLMYTGAKT